MASSKKNRAKRRRKRQQQVQAGNIPAVSDNLQGMVADIRNALDANRPKRAWALARQVATKMEPDAKEHLPLVTEALAARISEMLRDGYLREAIQMANDLLARHPDWTPCLSTGFWLELECAGAEPIRLLQYSESEDAARKIDDWIRVELTDPTCLADQTALAADHPLRVHSTLIRDAWQKIETEENKAAQEALRGIPRRSPFSPWRLFLQALSAYYDRDDRAALKALEHIPSGTVASRSGEMLRLLIDGVPANDPRIAGLSVRNPVADLFHRWRSVVKGMKANDFLACRSRLAVFGKAAVGAGYRSLALVCLGKGDYTRALQWYSHSCG